MCVFYTQNTNCAFLPICHLNLATLLVASRGIISNDSSSSVLCKSRSTAFVQLLVISAYAFSVFNVNNIKLDGKPLRRSGGTGPEVLIRVFKGPVKEEIRLILISPVSLIDFVVCTWTDNDAEKGNLEIYLCSPGIWWNFLYSLVECLAFKAINIGI